MSDKIIGYSCVFDERFIVEEGQLAVVQSRIFKTPEAAKKFYYPGERGQIVKVVITQLAGQQLGDNNQHDDDKDNADKP